MLASTIKVIGVDKIPETKYTRKELKCLVDNIYHEARGEPFEGQVLVGVVTLNRTEDGKICKAVYAPRQFSWVGRFTRTRETEAYRTAYDAAMYSMQRTEDVYYFHSKHIKPKWMAGKIVFKRIGNHVFYTE